MSIPAELFARAVELEETDDKRAAALYQQVLTLDKEHAAAHINLGTIAYRRQDYALAEQSYLAAIAIDPDYALAYFDLGNVFDETFRHESAIVMYLKAVKLAPTYADAHYNLALTYEKLHQQQNALRHWQAYTKMDNKSPWATHAYAAARRILAATRLYIATRNDKPARTPDRAKLEVL